MYSSARKGGKPPATNSANTPQRRIPFSIGVPRTRPVTPDAAQLEASSSTPAAVDTGSKSASLARSIFSTLLDDFPAFRPLDIDPPKPPVVGATPLQFNFGQSIVSKSISHAAGTESGFQFAIPTKQETDLESRNKNMRNALECPTCLELCIPPVYQCENGHLVCNACRPKLTSCGVCRVKMPTKGIRCLALETLANELEFDCENWRKGCTAKLKCSDVESHRFDCNFGTLLFCKSLFTGEHKCGPIANRADAIIGHLLETHCGKLVPDHETVLVRQTAPTTPNPTFGTLAKLPAPLCITYDSKVFVVQPEIRHSRNTITWKVFIVGSSNMAQKYRAKLTLQSGKNPNDTSSHLAWIGSVQGVDDISASANMWLELPLPLSTGRDAEDAASGFVASDSNSGISWTLSIEILKTSDFRFGHEACTFKKRTLLNLGSTQ